MSADRPLRGNRCLCRTCAEYFNSAAAFDKHRTGTYDLTTPGYGRRCQTAAEMLKVGMTINATGFWLTGAANTWHLNLSNLRRRRDRVEAVVEGQP